MLLSPDKAAQNNKSPALNRALKSSKLKCHHKNLALATIAHRMPEANLARRL